MSRASTLIALSLAAMALPAMGQSPAAPLDSIVAAIRWYGQDSIVFRLGGKTVAIDPYRIRFGIDKADLVLVTHSHDDHYSPSNIAMLATKATVKLAPFEAPGFRRIAAGERIDLGFCAVEAVPAYNVVKTRFHPRSNGWVGYIIEIEGRRIYVTGDTERIPEMKELRADLMLLPLGQTYTMGSVAEAVEAVKDVGPAVAIPIHWGMFEGTRGDADEFRRLLEGSGVIVEVKPLPNR